MTTREVSRAAAVPFYFAPFARGLGVDVESAQAWGATFDRAKTLRWLDASVLTKNGNRRDERVRFCGHLWAASCGGQLGVAHKLCRDRFCPGCQRRRQRELAKLLRTFVESRRDALERTRDVTGALMFPTLTQPKQDARHESAEQAIARLLAARRDMMNTKTAHGVALRRSIVGGVWFIELTWSYRGQKYANGHRVAYSGWHAHLHGLVELAPGVHMHDARAALADAWARACPESCRAAQKIKPVVVERVAQVCKYVCKPFDMVNPKRAREAAVALAGIRHHNGWGSWRSWKNVARELLDIDDETLAPPIVMGNMTLAKTWAFAQSTGATDDDGVLAGASGRVYFDQPGQPADEVGRAATDVLAGIFEDPRPFNRRREHASDNDDREDWREEGERLRAEWSESMSGVWSCPKCKSPDCASAGA